MADERDILQELDQLRAELAAVKAQCAQQAREAVRADDYRQIMNAMMAHGFCYEGQAQTYELERFWTKTMPDISYNGYYGQEGVRSYYTETPEKIRSSQREIVRRVYGADIPDDACVGYHVMNMVCSPFIEIAKDGKTAQGVWMELSIKCHLDEDGEPVTSVGTSKCASDFVKEDGTWKIWHGTYGAGQGFSLDVKVDNYRGPNEAPKEMSMKLPYASTPEDQKRYGFRRRKGAGMPPEVAKPEPGGPGKQGPPPMPMSAPWGGTVTFEPRLPEPYDTWDPRQACVQFENE